MRWFAAEIAVVVAGVLLALAANDWAQGAREQRLAEEYTVRIVEDLDRFAASLQGVIDWSNAVHAAGELLLPVLEGETPDEPELAVTAAYQAARMQSPDLSPIAYRELLATGQIRLFRDANVRQRLGAYFADLERADGFLNSIPPDYSRRARSTLPLQVQLRIHDSCGNTAAPRHCSSLPEAGDAHATLQRLLAEPELLPALRLRLAHQHFVRRYAEQQHASNRALRELLAPPPTRSP